VFRPNLSTGHISATRVGSELPKPTKTLLSFGAILYEMQDSQAAAVGPRCAP
jgi:hypothetical protein